MDVEKHNLAQIERLNQRGGRTLSVLDLMEDGTLTAEMAAFCWCCVEAGDSFLTGAVPGGVGKTTLMATLLGFLPPGDRIVTVSRRGVIEQGLRGEVEQPATFLAHEIGSGSWFGYIWGADAAAFFRLTAQDFRCASCLHADTPQQTRDQLLPLGVRAEDLARVPLLLYMVAERSGMRLRRRVAALSYLVDGERTALYRWQREDDRFQAQLPRERIAELLAGRLSLDAERADHTWRHREELLTQWHEEGIRRFEQVRARVVTSYGREEA
ncbi:MAG: hypothetical protein R6V05_00580 [Candidatus Brocadiia bacterium]